MALPHLASPHLPSPHLPSPPLLTTTAEGNHQVWVTHDIEKAPAFKVPRGRIIVKEPDEVEAQRLLLRAQGLFNGGRLLDAAADYGRVIRLKVSELISLLTTR